MQPFSKWIVALIICLNLGFTAAVLYIFIRIGNEPTALIAAWFAFTTGELWLLSGIKKEKLRGERRIEDQRDKYPV
jgi:hypothetical protein